MYTIALKMLFGDRTKLIGLVAGVAFTTLLINQQAGILIGLLNRAGSLVSDASECDLWIMDPGVKTVDVVFPLRDTELQRVRGVQGVQWAVPYFKGAGTVRNSVGTVEGTIVIGIDDSSLIGIPQRVLAGSLSELRRPQSIALEPDGYRRIWPGESFQVGRIVELNDRRAEVVAIVDASPSFASGPTVYTRYSQALQYTNNGRNQLSFILARTYPDTDPAVVAQKISRATGLKARPREVFRQENISYIIGNTGIPVSIGTVVALGIIVGVAVVSLLLNLFVVENLKQFAALKAIGINNLRLMGMVLLQTYTAGAIGWALGLGASAAFFQFAGQGDPNFRGFYLPWYIALGSGLLAIAIILFASTLSLRRVLYLDPATVFRG